MASIDRDWIEAALLEQHRWECNCEGVYRRGFQSEPIDEACFNDMLMTFGIARNLSQTGKLRLRTMIREIAQLHTRNPTDWREIFHATGATEDSDPEARLYIEGSKGSKNVPRAFVSGLTKVLWFAGTHCMPMFDSLTCLAVRPKGGSQYEKAIDFYEVLENGWDYRKVFYALEQVRESQEVSWCFFPERFIDKLLLIKGLKKIKRFESSFMMGSPQRRAAYLGVLTPPVREELKGLVARFCDAMANSRFNEKLAK